MNNYVGGQYRVAHKVPTFPPVENGSQGSGSRFGLAMPQGYQVKTSPTRPSTNADQRLVMLAKYPNATNGDIDNAMQRQQQRRMKQQLQQNQQQLPPQPGHPQRQVAFQAAPQSIPLPQPQPVRVTHTRSTPAPPRAGLQQGSFAEPWEELPAPPSQKRKKFSFWGKFFKVGTADRDDDSRDNSYAKSHASEMTRKVSNVDEKARAKRLKQEAKERKAAANGGSASSRSDCGWMYKTRTGLFLCFVVIVLLLAAILIMALGYEDRMFGKKQAAPDLENPETVETWIPRPIGSDTDTSFPTPSPTIDSSGNVPGIIPTNPQVNPPTAAPTTRKPTFPPTPRPTLAPVVGPTPPPTPYPTRRPTNNPTPRPTPPPTTLAPTKSPTKRPTSFPTRNPTPFPTRSPTPNPTTRPPTSRPTEVPSTSPTFVLRDLIPLGSTLIGYAGGQRFGYSVSLSKDGTVMAVGIPFADVSGASEAGMVQVYEWNDNGWAVRGSALTGRNTEDKFGSAIAMSEDGNLLVVSEPNFEGKAGTNSGNVRTFRYSLGEKAYLSIGRELEGVSAADRFGISVAMNKSGTRLVVGAPYHDNSVDDRRLVSGEVQTYELVNNVWESIESPLEGEAHFDWFGWKVDMNDDGDVMCAGAPRNLQFGGYVMCYQLENGKWKQRGNVIRNVQPTRYDDNFGHSLRVDGNRVAVGVPGRNHDVRIQDSGFVVVYELDASTNAWRRLGDTVKFSDPNRSDQFGFSVDLEGNTLAVGSPGRNSRGQVDLFYYDPSTNEWEANPNPLTGIRGSTFGFSISMTRNLAIGSAVSEGQNTGKVNVYQQRY